jgi:hypothetical protein
MSANAATSAARNRVLVVLLCETRAWELTAEKLGSNVLDELHADLALCVGDREAPNPLYQRANYVWRLAEPENWADAYDRAAQDRPWRVLLEVDEQLLGGIQDPEHPQVGSGAIGLYFRKFLKESLEQAGIAEDYDWLVVTRSDLIWPVPHPDVRYLSDRHFYVLDGEDYGGVCDRHFIVPRRFIQRFLSVADPLFTDPEDLKRRIDRRRAAQGWAIVNVERFLALRLDDLGLWRHVSYLPYAPFCVRAPGGSTRWSQGEFDEGLGYYVKYPEERERSRITQGFIRGQGSWKKHLSPIRGARMRRQLTKAFRERGFDERLAEAREYERAFPRPRGMHVRFYRWAQSAVPQAAQKRKGAVPFIGRQLRKVPGVSPLLDARLRRIRRRAVRDD